MTRLARPRCPACGCWRTEGLPCGGCLYLTRRARERVDGRRCRNCNTLLPDGHTASRCDACWAARSAEDFEYKKRAAAKRFPPAVRRALTARVAAGEPLTDVCASLETTQQQAHGFKMYDPEWAEELDGALLAGRDPELAHGTAGAYRHGRCRCPECREYKLGHDSWQWRRQPARSRG